ncbi:exosome complex component RRP46-like [Sitophilus oryzae]|uniref:Exosome complex component RRP46-like n=1 Tax=Sitophilus oryzae TaxID=7048 RepID=A0A6J2YB21_SITOR|nr:exosome complex component RRP46-like [Sitophilus oryzae]
MEVIESFENNLNLKCKLQVLSRADGSAMFSEGQTVVLSAIYGPVEVKMQKLLIEKASVESVFKPKSGLPGVSDRYKEYLIKNICETALASALYPRTAVLVNLQEMQNQGQLISCAINAVCLACLDSGIDMKFLFGAVSYFLTKEEELTLTPPINESSVKAMFVFVFNNTKGDVIASHTEGRFSIDQYKTALDICRDEVKKVFIFFKETLLDT